MGAALLWTSQVQTNITDVQKNTLPLTGKIAGAKSNNSGFQKILLLSQGKFLAINSEPHTVGRNAGIFWILYQMSGVLGSTFVLVLFRNVDVIDQVSFSTARY